VSFPADHSSAAFSRKESGSGLCVRTMGLFPSGDGTGKVGDTLKAYLFIEGFIWLPTMWVICYRFQPAIRIWENPSGRQMVMRGSTVLERYVPSFHASLSKLAGRIYGSPNGRTTAEWLLINKVLSPVAFPMKVAVGGMWVERRRRAQEAASSAPALQETGN